MPPLGCIYYRLLKVAFSESAIRFSSHFLKKNTFNKFAYLSLVKYIGTHSKKMKVVLKIWTQSKHFWTSRWNRYVSCILLSKLIWPIVGKNVFVIVKNFWNSRLKAEDLQKFWDHSNNSFKQWKVRTICETECLANLSLEVFQI